MRLDLVMLSAQDARIAAGAVEVATRDPQGWPPREAGMLVEELRRAQLLLTRAADRMEHHARAVARG